jgi:hypothetical protein
MISARAGLRRSEWVLSAFFMYIAALTLWREGSLTRLAANALVVPIVLVAVARTDARSRRKFWSIARDWIAALLLLIAYWSTDWPQSRPSHRLEQALIVWDRTILDAWGLRAAIERFGAVVPIILELAYSLVYLVLPAAIVGFYIGRRRDRLDQFLFLFFCGALAAYALLPLFPSAGPRFVFTGQDLPNVDTVLRRFNLWILDHGDIKSSIFPSGHVAVCFAAACALGVSVPEKPAAAWAMFALAALVWVSTIYGRYHYAADGLASLAVTASVIGAVAAWNTARQQDD